MAAYTGGATRVGWSMTQMLASVTGVEEAALALDAGADIVDLAGPALALTTIREAVGVGGDRGAVSVTVGGQAPGAAALREIAACGVQLLRVAMPPAGEVAFWLTAFAAIAPTVRLIALFADLPAEPSSLREIAAGGFAGAMIDTGDRGPVRLLDRIDMPRLRLFAESCRELRLAAGFAGRLETPDIPRLLVLEPDLLGFREVLRGPGGPSAPLNPARMRAVRRLIPPAGASAAPRPVAAPSPDLPVDRVFVEDFVLPVVIGAYAREHQAPQRVRFAVDAYVARMDRTVQDMRDVFSYDLITDGIRLLVAAGHVAFVENLAERIAAMVLGHPRVTRVVVRVAKLETEGGTVGVEIVRLAGSAAATP